MMTNKEYSKACLEAFKAKSVDEALAKEKELDALPYNEAHRGKYMCAMIYLSDLIDG